ncbi:MAG TPA: tetratricopeptide repeat protein [Pyrinomonadaceae bacterium]
MRLVCAVCRLGCAVVVVLVGGARAQQPRALDPAESYRILMAERMERSRKAVEETLRRRYEERRDEGRPGNGEAAAKPGVVRAVSPEERQALARTEKGLEYFAQSKFAEAVKEYNEALRLWPRLASAHNNLGSAYFALGRYDAAAESFRHAVGVEPNYGQAHFNLALAYLKLGREQEAGEALTAAARAYFATGEEQIKAGRREEAEATFKELLRLDPQYPPAHLRLGALHYAAGRFAEAAAAFELVARAQADNAYAHEGLAAAYVGLRRFKEAAAAAERAVKLKPDEPGAYYFAGLAYVALGRREEARAACDKLRALHADADAQALADALAQP